MLKVTFSKNKREREKKTKQWLTKTSLPFSGQNHPGQLPVTTLASANVHTLSVHKIHSPLDISTAFLSLLQRNWSFFAACPAPRTGGCSCQRVVAHLAVHIQVIHEFFPAGIEEAVSEIGADPGSTKMSKITLFRASRRECQACVCFYWGNFTKVVIKWLNKQLEEISWFVHQGRFGEEMGLLLLSSLGV